MVIILNIGSYIILHLTHQNRGILNYISMSFTNYLLPFIIDIRILISKTLQSFSNAQAFSVLLSKAIQ